MRPTSIFVGGLNADIQREDLEREFNKFGTMNKIWVARNPPGFAFIEFSDDQDANDAIKEMNGAMINGSQIRVDLSRNNGGGGGGGGGGRRGGGNGYGGRGGGFRSGGGGGGGGFRSGGGPRYGGDGGGGGGGRQYGNDGGNFRGSGYRNRSPDGR